MNLKENKDKKSMRAILQDVSRVTGVPKALILSRVRKQKVADARMLFCHMARRKAIFCVKSHLSSERVTLVYLWHVVMWY